MKDMEKVLVALSVKEKFNWESVYNDILNKYTPTEEELENANKFIESVGGNITTIISENYPTYFKEQSNPPFVIVMNMRGR